MTVVLAALVVSVAAGFALVVLGNSPNAAAPARSSGPGTPPLAAASPAAAAPTATPGPRDAAASPSGAPAPSPYAGPLTKVVPVLMYHRIGDPPPGARYPGLYVSQANFSAQMQALHDAGWRSITAGELGVQMAAGRPVPVKTFVITFDDGYRDNFTAALPILEHFGFVATFSVVATGGPEMMSPEQLAALVAAGMEVGNHTLGHKNVSRLTGVALWQQIEGGDQLIAQKLASQGAAEAIRTFVYPSGHVGPAALALLARLGYLDAFTEVPGFASIGTTAPMQIPRIRVSRSETLGQFLARMPHGPAA